MKTTKRQTFYLEGNAYAYRITKAALLRYEQEAGRQITLAMPLTQIVRALYYVTCMLPYGVTADSIVKPTAKGCSARARTAANTPSEAYGPCSFMHGANSSDCSYSTTEHKKRCGGFPIAPFRLLAVTEAEYSFFSGKSIRRGFMNKFHQFFRLVPGGAVRGFAYKVKYAGYDSEKQR